MGLNYTDMKIEVTPDAPKKSQPTLPEKITAIANSWAESLLDEDRGHSFITSELTEAVSAKIGESLGIRIRDDWHGRKIEIDMYSERPLARLIRDYADREVRRIIEEMEFEPVVLTQNEVSAIQRAYRVQIKESALDAARTLAERSAIELAKTVLGLEDIDI